MIDKTYARFTAWALVALGVSVLIGWQFDITAFKTVLPGLNSMKVNTAFAFMLSGITLFCFSDPGASQRLWSVGAAAAVVVMLIGGLSALEYLLGLNFGIDEFFYIDDASRQSGTVVPGQMSIISASLFLAAGAAALLFRTVGRIRERTFVCLSTAGLVMGLLLLLVLIYGAPFFFLKIRAATVAVHTVVGFLLLFSGLAALRPDLGLAARLNSQSAGGVFMRRMTLGIALGVPIIGWLRLQGELLGWYDGRVGLALFACANVVLLTAVIWIASYNADRTDSERLQEKVAQQKALTQFSTEALSASSMSDLFKLAATCLQSTLRAKISSVLEVDEALGTLKGISSSEALDFAPFERRTAEYLPSSVLNYAIRQKKFFWFSDIATETRFTFIEGEKAGFRSGATLPIVGGSRTTRFVSVFFGQPHQFTSDELEFMQSLGNTLSVAWERRRVADALRSRMEQRNALAVLSESALRFSSLAELSKAAIGVAFNSLLADFGSFAEFDETKDNVNVLSMAQGSDITSVTRRISAYPSSSVLEFTLKSDDAFWFSDIEQERRFTFTEDAMKPYKSGLVVPVAGNDGRKRRLSVFFLKPRNFTADEISFLTSIAVVTATAHERIRAVEALRTQNEALEKADRAKSQFLAMMSHELRTPMAGLLGMADLLKLTKLDQEQSQMIGRLIRSGKALLEILNDILDFSKLDADKMTLETVPFRLSDMLADLRELFAPIASEKGLNLSFAMPLRYQDAVTGDAKHIRQVITNLLNNAMKFTANGSVTVSLTQTITAEQALRNSISVTDTGIGIEPDKLRLLFKPFVQADASTSRQFGGTGLGLAICDRLVKLMGGEMAVSSRPGQGSTFAFSVTLQADHAAESGVQQISAGKLKAQARLGSNTARASAACRILLAEDNETNRMLISAMLQRQGHSVEAVENGKQALDAVRENKYDVVLMDMQMPVMDGLSAIRSIRESERDVHIRVPIIALTADVIVEHGQRYLEAGADALVSKPVSWAILFDEIERQVALRVQGEGSEGRGAPVR
ncbi:MAG: response regulator [Rhodospirillaceae bacterium]|nr:response regulator [Rhodospirillaceae bacterium]